MLVSGDRLIFQATAEFIGSVLTHSMDSNLKCESLLLSRTYIHVHTHSSVFRARRRFSSDKQCGISLGTTVLKLTAWRLGFKI